MRTIKASASSDSKRMFDSEFFEFFSRIHPWQPPVLFVPIIGYLLFRSVDGGVGLGAIGGLYAAGLLFWTLLEYWLHREVFHYVPTSKFAKRVFWLLHGVHHDWPNDKFRLVFPPTLSLPLAAFFFFIFTLVVGDVLRYPLMAGLASGYLAYDMLHYWTHHFSPRSRAGKFLRRYHLAHHFKAPDRGFGVSSPLWDYVFGTAPESKSRAP